MCPPLTAVAEIELLQIITQNYLVFIPISTGFVVMKYRKYQKYWELEVKKNKKMCDI